MPMNDHVVIPRVMNWVEDIQPKKILDVGMGFGLWGMLCREFAGFNFDPEKVDKWAKTGEMDISITGIEVYGDYIKSLQEEIYDSIIVGDALEVLPEMHADRKFDCILLMDVIEHFSKENAYKLIDLCLERSNHLLISTPLGAMVWDNWDCNYPREEHQSGWNLRDFKEYNVVDFDYIDQRLKQRKQIVLRIEWSKQRVKEIIEDTTAFVEGSK